MFGQSLSADEKNKRSIALEVGAFKKKTSLISENTRKQSSQTVLLKSHKLQELETPFIQTKEVYQKAEERARIYLNTLRRQLKQGEYLDRLLQKSKYWKKNHIRNDSIWKACFSFSEPEQQDSNEYLKWLRITKRLDGYLDRSVAYLFVRDLGQSIEDPKSKQQIDQVVQTLKQYIEVASRTDMRNGDLDLSKLYHKSKELGVEHTMVWLMEKIQHIQRNIPEGIAFDQTMRKLVKVIAGVTMLQYQNMDCNVSQIEKREKLDTAIRMGYYYGITYPLIDDLLDSDRALTKQERDICSKMIGVALEMGTVPAMPQIEGANQKVLQFVYSELKEAFDAMKEHQTDDRRKSFFEKAYVFYQSQENDRSKTLSNPTYTNEDLYLPVILKSASSRLIARSILGNPEDTSYDDRIFYFGILNQMHDDMADIEEDLSQGQVTPFTYYLTHHETRSDLIKPSSLYWAVVNHLIEEVYQDNPKVQEMLLSRAINLQKSMMKQNPKRYNERMKALCSESPEWNQILQQLIEHSKDTSFFDKILRQSVANYFLEQGKDGHSFVQTLKVIGQKINRILPVKPDQTDQTLGDTLVRGANYSLEAGGKRIRPVLAYALGVQGYGLKEETIEPLLRSIEYMHTASLIFDDLPSQDNANMRRGRPTLHQHLGSAAAAELTALFLTMKATEEQATLTAFEPQKVQQLIQYSSRVIEDMCKGQYMDLESKKKTLTLQQLETLSFYKTGIALEASLLMPAILASAPDMERTALRNFARHAGIAFQIKDDILDVEGDPRIMGKASHMDAENNNSTFVSVLGLEEAKVQLYDHYFQALEALQTVPRNTAFLKQILQYIVNRDR